MKQPCEMTDFEIQREIGWKNDAIAFFLDMLEKSRERRQHLINQQLLRDAPNQTSQ